MNRLMFKRSLRDIKKNVGRYLALMLLIGFAIYMVLSMMGASMTIQGEILRYDELLNVEDGEFTVFVPLNETELDKLTSRGISIERIFSLDYELSDGSVLRVFRNRENIDLVSVAEGSLPASDNDAVIERRYAEEHALSVGDSITVGGKVFNISGIGVAPDYNSPVRNLSDSAVDSVSFGTMFVTSSSYDILLSEGNAMKSEEYTYAYTLNGVMTDDELREILEDNKFDVSDIDDPYFLEYWEDMVGRKDDLLEGIDELNDGASELRDGANELADGAHELTDGVGELNDAIPDLQSGANDLYNGASSLDDGIDSYTSGVSATASGASELSDGLNEIESGCDALQDGSDQYMDGLQQYNDGLYALSQSDDPLTSNAAAAQYAAASSLQDGYGGIDQGIDGIAAGVSSASSGAGELSDGLDTITSNNDVLTDGSGALVDGMGEMRDGINDLADGVGELNEGVTEFGDGVDELVDGINEYADGIDEFTSEANDLIDEVFDIDTANLMTFLPADSNPRIDAAYDDEITDLYASTVVGVIALILFAYVISVFVIHSIDRESSVIGALYSLGVKRSSIAFGYIVIPVIVTFLAGAAGTLIALYTPVGIPSEMHESFSYYSNPDMTLKIKPFVLIYGLVLPSLITIVVNVIVIRGRLNRNPLSLLKNEQKAVKARDIKIKKMKFIPLFRIRQLLREMRTGMTVIFGMFLSLLIVMLALTTLIYCVRVKDYNTRYTDFEYFYTYKYPEKEVPEGGYEAVIEETTKDFGDFTFDVAVAGVTRDNPFFDLSSLTDKASDVVVSYSFAYKYGLSVGDEFTVKDKSGEKLYAFRVSGIDRYQASMMIFMDIDDCRDLFGESDDYFNAVFADHELDIASGRLAATLTKKDISNASGVFVDCMRGMVTTLLIAGAVIFVVVMYLMIKMMLDRASFNISLVKIFGFRNREVKKMYLDGNLIMIVVGALVCIPLCKLLLNYIYPNMLVANVNVGLPMSYPIFVYVAIFAAIVGLYLIISAFLFISIRRTTPALVLKNRE